MSKGAAPSQDQLLDLMKRAAEELKHAQEEARTAVHALQKEQAAHQKTEAELEAAREGAAAGREALLARVTEAEAALSVALQLEEARRQRLVEEHEKTLAEVKEAQERALDESRKAIAEAEADRAGTLDAAAGKLVQAEAQLAQERDKHQATAQKLIEIRARVRELESTAAGQQERVTGLEATARQLAAQHEEALREAAEAQQKATADLQANLVSAQQELASVTGRWREVERQYEALHREMLLTLEQRDEARKMLENERVERMRLSNARHR